MEPFRVVKWRVASLLMGVAPEKNFKSAKTAASRIWERIQGLGEAAKPKEERKAKAGAPAAKGAPTKSKATKKGHRRQESAQGQEGRESIGNRRAAGGQQDRSGGCDAPAEERRHSAGDHGQDGLAENTPFAAS